MKVDFHLKELIKKGSSTFIFKFLGVILSYIIVALITKDYGVETYGRYSFSIMLSQIIAVIFSLGIPIHIIKIVTNSYHYNTTFKTNFFKKISLLITFIGFTISIFLYFSSSYISKNILNDLEYTFFLKIVSFIILPLMFHEIFLGFFKGIKNFLKHNILLFILPHLLFLSFYFILKDKFNQESFTLICYAFSLSIVFLIEIFLVKKKSHNKKTKNYPTKQLIKKSLPIMYSGVFIYLLGWTDIFMLEYFKGAKEVGVYNLIFKVASLGFIILTAINVVIAPKISELFIKKETLLLHKLILNSTRIIFIFTLPLVLSIIFFRKNILTFFGEEFIQGEQALIYIVIGVLFSVFSGTVDQILNMTNNQKILKNILIFSFVLNVILNVILIPSFGLNGAAISSLIINVFLNLTCIVYIKKKLGFYTFI